MKTLWLMRHGDAESHSEQGDHGRKLSSIGEKEVVSVAYQMLEKRILPQRVFYSSSTRTTQTALLCKEIWDSNEISWFSFSELYLASPETAKGLFTSSYVENIRSILLVGHNPGWSRFVSELSGQYISMDTGHTIGLQIQEKSWFDAVESAGLWSIKEHYVPSLR